MQFRFACGRIGFRINSAPILGVVVTLFAFVERAGRRADVCVHARSAIDYFVYNGTEIMRMQETDVAEDTIYGARTLIDEIGWAPRVRTSCVYV